jgi:hypothetical protein
LSRSSKRCRLVIGGLVSVMANFGFSQFAVFQLRSRHALTVSINYVLLLPIFDLHGKAILYSLERSARGRSRASHLEEQVPRRPRAGAQRGR